MLHKGTKKSPTQVPDFCMIQTLEHSHTDKIKDK